MGKLVMAKVFNGQVRALEVPYLQSAVVTFVNNQPLTNREKYLLGGSSGSRTQKDKDALIRWFAIRRGRVAGRHQNGKWHYDIPKSVRDTIRTQRQDCKNVFDTDVADGAKI